MQLIIIIHLLWYNSNDSPINKTVQYILTQFRRNKEQEASKINNQASSNTFINSIHSTFQKIHLFHDLYSQNKSYA